MLKYQNLSPCVEDVESFGVTAPVNLPALIQGDLEVTMSNSNSTSRSSSPPVGEGSAKPRAVSGSLKDRIAKFNNPSASPLVPTHPFGSAGPGSSSTAGGGNRGLYGNRIPSLDPKSAGHVPIGTRKVSEQRGLIGNRIPSSVSGRDVAGLTGDKTGGGSVPAPKSVDARSASPSGSVDSSTQSNTSVPADSGSPSTSRSSSAPTSPGGGLPPSLLAATLPDTGGPGAMTPSSTRAEAGEDTSQLSAPTTPVVGATIQLPPAEYDLVPGNLKLAAAAQMTRGLSATSGPRSFAPSVTSSLASQYDPSSQGNEEKQMMQDVSGISTPMGTPRAARRDLDGSTRGEGSVIGEGSVVGDAEEGDMEGVSQKLERLAVEQRDREEWAERTPTPEAISYAGDDMVTPSKDVSEPILDVPASAPTENSAINTGGFIDLNEEDYVQRGTEINAKDPNQAGDLDALKRGHLGRDPNHQVFERNPINNLAHGGMSQQLDEQRPKQREMRQQGGAAGQRMEDIEKPDRIEPPSDSTPNPSIPASEQQSSNSKEEKASQGSASSTQSAQESAGAPSLPTHDDVTVEDVTAETAHAPGMERRDIKDEDIEVGSEINVKDVSPLSHTGQARDTRAKQEAHDARHPEGAREAREEESRHAIQASFDGLSAKESFVNEAFSGKLEAYAEPDEEAKGEQEGQGVLSAPGHVEFVGPHEVSALEKVGVGQDAHAEAKAARVTSDIAKGNSLDHPNQKTKEDEEAEHLDKRDGKTFAGQLAKEAEITGVSRALAEEVEKGRLAQAEAKLRVDAGMASSGYSDVPVEGQVEESATAESGTSPETEVNNVDKENEIQTESKGPIASLPPPLATSKPIQVHVEPAPIAQPIDETDDIPTNDKDGGNDVSDSNPETITSEIVPPEPSKTPAPPDFPEPPHNDLDVDDQVDIDQPSTSDGPSSAQLDNGEARSSTPIDPQFIKAFPPVPDDVHPRVEIRVSPHVTPVKSPLDRRFSGGASQETPTKSPLANIQTTENDKRSEQPEKHTPEKETAQSNRDSLDVDSPLGTPTDLTHSTSASGLSKRSSTRKSPKSPLLDDEDPGDFVPGEEGWAVVTKRGAGFVMIWIGVSWMVGRILRPPDMEWPNG